MSVFITSLNSGSNGNCYYIGNNKEAVLIDAGISCKETEKRMKRLGLSLTKVKAIFISHEHIDHIRGVDVIAKKYQLPVYITPATLTSARLNIDKSLIKSFNSYAEIKIGKLSIIAFPKQHDAADPFSFIVRQGELNIGVFTDIGSNCEHVIRNFKLCNAIFLEANYDEKMLEEGSYPVYLKNRIRSDKGHLSNSQALELFINHKPEFMSHLILSHLSKDNNDPELVHSLFAKHSKNTAVIVASRYKETPVYHIQNNNGHLIQHPDKISSLTSQMSLFEE